MVKIDRDDSNNKTQKPLNKDLSSGIFALEQLLQNLYDIQEKEMSQGKFRTLEEILRDPNIKDLLQNKTIFDQVLTFFGKEHIELKDIMGMSIRVDKIIELSNKRRNEMFSRVQQMALYTLTVQKYIKQCAKQLKVKTGKIENYLKKDRKLPISPSDFTRNNKNKGIQRKDSFFQDLKQAIISFIFSKASDGNLSIDQAGKIWKDIHNNTKFSFQELISHLGNAKQGYGISLQYHDEKTLYVGGTIPCISGQKKVLGFKQLMQKILNQSQKILKSASSNHANHIDPKRSKQRDEKASFALSFYTLSLEDNIAQYPDIVQEVRNIIHQGIAWQGFKHVEVGEHTPEQFLKENPGAFDRSGYLTKDKDGNLVFSPEKFQNDKKSHNKLFRTYIQRLKGKDKKTKKLLEILEKYSRTGKKKRCFDDMMRYTLKIDDHGNVSIEEGKKHLEDQKQLVQYYVDKQMKKAQDLGMKDVLFAYANQVDENGRVEKVVYTKERLWKMYTDFWRDVYDPSVMKVSFPFFGASQLVFKNKKLRFHYDSLEDEDLWGLSEDLFEFYYEIDIEHSDPLLMDLLGGKRWINLENFAHERKEKLGDIGDIKEHLGEIKDQTLTNALSYLHKKQKGRNEREQETEKEKFPRLFREKEYHVRQNDGTLLCTGYPMLISKEDQKGRKVVLRFYDKNTRFDEDAYLKGVDETSPFLIEISSAELEGYSFEETGVGKPSTLLFSAHPQQNSVLHAAFFAGLDELGKAQEKSTGKIVMKHYEPKQEKKYKQLFSSLQEFENTSLDDSFEDSDFYRSHFSIFDDFYNEVKQNIEESFGDEKALFLLNALKQRNALLQEKGGLPAWIWKGKIYFNKNYFEKNYHITITKKDGIYLFNGKALQDPDIASLKNEKTEQTLYEEMKSLKNHEIMHRILQVHNFKFSRDVKAAVLFGEENALDRERKSPQWLQQIQGNVVRISSDGDDVFFTHEMLADIAGNIVDDKDDQIDRKLKPYKIIEINKKDKNPENRTVRLLGNVPSSEGDHNRGKEYIVSIKDIEKAMSTMIAMPFSFDQLGTIDVSLLDKYEKDEIQFNALGASASSVDIMTQINDTEITGNPGKHYVYDATDSRGMVNVGGAGNASNIIQFDPNTIQSETDIDNFIDQLRNIPTPVILPWRAGPRNQGGGYGIGDSLQQSHPDLYDYLQDQLEQFRQNPGPLSQQNQDSQDQSQQDQQNENEQAQEQEETPKEKFFKVFNTIKGYPINVDEHTLNGIILYFRGDASIFPGGGTEWIKATIQYEPGNNTYDLIVQDATETQGHISETFTMPCSEKHLKKILSQFSNEVYKLPSTGSFQEMYSLFIETSNTLSPSTLFQGLHMGRWKDVNPRKQTKLGSVGLRKTESPIAYFGIEEGYSGSGYTFYKVDLGPSQITVSNHKEGFQKTMDYTTFFLFSCDKHLTPFSKEEYENLNKKYQKPSEQTTSPQDRLFSLKHIFDAIKKIPQAFKFRLEQRDSYHAAVLYEKFLRFFPNVDFLYISDIKTEALSELDSQTRKVISNYKERLMRMDMEEQGGIHKGKALLRVKQEIFQKVGDMSIQFRQKAAGYFLFLLENESIYPRELSDHASKGTRVGALLGKEHQQRFLKLRKQKFDDLRTKAREDEEMFGALLQYEVEYIGQHTGLQNLVHIFGSKFPKIVEGYQNKEGQFIEKGRNTAQQYSNFYHTYQFVQSKIQKLEPGSIVGGLEELLGRVEYEHHYKMVYELIMQMAVSGVLENAIGNTGKSRLAKMGRTYGIPLLVMCRYPYFSSASTHIIDAIAKSANAPTITSFIQKSVSGFDPEETNIETFSLPLGGGSREDAHKNTRHVKITLAVSKRWNTYGPIVYKALNFKSGHFFQAYKKATETEKESLNYYMKKVHDGETNPDISVADDMPKTGFGPYYEQGILMLNKGAFSKLLMQFTDRGNFMHSTQEDFWNTFTGNIVFFDTQIQTMDGDPFVQEKMLLFLTKKLFTFFGSDLGGQKIQQLNQAFISGQSQQVRDIILSIKNKPINENSAIEGIEAVAHCFEKHTAKIQHFATKNPDDRSFLM